MAVVSFIATYDAPSVTALHLFTDAWVQRKLGEVCATFADGDWIESKDQSNEGIRLLQTGNVGVNEFIDRTDRAKWISEDTFIRLKCTEVYPGDILISRLPEPAGRACIVPDIGQKMITAVDCTIVRTSEKCVSEYLVQVLSSQFYFKTVNDFLTGGTRQRISKSNLAGFTVPLPRKEEQKEIGQFFTSLDTAITLYQRKLDGLRELKKGYLQQMFPKADERVPRVRFTGFSREWQEKRLGEMLTERNEQFEESAEYPLMSFVGNIGVVPKGEKYDRSFLVKGDDKKYKRTELNDFIYSSNNLETGSIGFNKTGKAVISPVYSIFYSKNDSESQFIGLLSMRRDFINKMIHFRQGVMYGQWRIHEKDFLEIKILTPLTQEQNCVIKFFNVFDEQITTLSTKIARLRELKAAYLQKMFV